MYKRSVAHASYERIPAGFELIPGAYKPFSYFVLGGVDVSGEALRMDSVIEHDESDVCDAFMSTDPDVEMSTMSQYNPRTSALDMAEMSGVGAYDDYISNREAAKAAQSQSQTE